MLEKNLQKMEQLQDLLGAEALLEEVIQAFSSDELEEMVDWIARMHDIDFTEF